MTNYFTETLNNKGFAGAASNHPKQVLYQAEPRAEYFLLSNENSCLTLVFAGKTTIQRPALIVNPIHSYSNVIKVVRGKFGENPLVVLNHCLPNSSDEFRDPKALLKLSQKLCGRHTPIFGIRGGAKRAMNRTPRHPYFSYPRDPRSHAPGWGWAKMITFYCPRSHLGNSLAGTHRVITGTSSFSTSNEGPKIEIRQNPKVACTGPNQSRGNVWHRSAS